MRLFVKTSSEIIAENKAITAYYKYDADTNYVSV